MYSKTAVMRNHKITLTNKMMEKLHIKKGDRLILDMQEDILIISKKRRKVSR